MLTSSVGQRLTSFLALAVTALPLAAAPPPTGFRDDARVAAATRLDWKFAASAFGPGAVKLPADYDSTRQRYQLFVPRAYDDKKLWPLVVFISPGDDPLGWRYWQQPCEKLGALFCAAYGAGNNCPAGQRTRIVLDMLDDVRRRYRTDPDQTYLTGFSGGGRMACTIAFALPEHFGGVAPVAGTNPLPRLDYLRHRVRDRLSVAFVTGENDFNRKENEALMAPLFRDMGIRSRLWVVPKLGHAVPSADVLTEVYIWLAADLERRRADARARPGLAADPQDVAAPDRRATRQFETAEAELIKRDGTWRGVALLRGVVERWPDTEAADRARKRLKEIQEDAGQMQALAEEGGREERQMLAAQASAMERFGDLKRARQAWRQLAQGHPQTPEGRKAEEEAKRLAAELAATPYLGVAFADAGTLIAEVVPRGPADRAGLRAGDKLLKVAGVKVASPPQVRLALARHKPGEVVAVEVDRGGKTVTVNVELGSQAD